MENPVENIKTSLGTLCFSGTKAEAAKLSEIAGIAATSPLAVELFARTNLEGYTFGFTSLFPTTAGEIHHEKRDIRFNARFGNLTLAPYLVHEIAHVEQERLGLSPFRPGISVADIILEDRLGEAAAYALGLEAAWEMSSHHEGRWAQTFMETPALSLVFQMEMRKGDTPETRKRARTKAFLGFFSDIQADYCENAITSLVEKMPPRTLRQSLATPNRSSGEYFEILERQGFTNLVRHIPEMTFDQLSLRGVNRFTTNRLLAASRKADIPEEALSALPQERHFLPRQAAYAAIACLALLPVF